MEEGCPLRVRSLLAKRCVPRLVIYTRPPTMKCSLSPFPLSDSSQPPTPAWLLLLQRFHSWTRHETLVFTTGSLNSIPSLSQSSRMTISGATTLPPFASRSSFQMISTSSPVRPLHLGVTATVILCQLFSTTLLYCPLLSRRLAARRHTSPRQ